VVGVAAIPAPLIQVVQGLAGEEEGHVGVGLQVGVVVGVVVTGQPAEKLLSKGGVGGAGHALVAGGVVVEPGGQDAPGVQPGHIEGVGPVGQDVGEEP